MIRLSHFLGKCLKLEIILNGQESNPFLKKAETVLTVRRPEIQTIRMREGGTPPSPLPPPPTPLPLTPPSRLLSLWFRTHLTLNLPFSILLRFQSSRKTKRNKTLPKTFPIFRAAQIWPCTVFALQWRTACLDVLGSSRPTLRLQAEQAGPSLTNFVVWSFQVSFTPLS